VTSRTALVLLAPRVDRALHDVRVRYFRNLARRMPAHVTMLFPFRSPVDAQTLATVGAMSAGLRAFDATFRESGRFRNDVVWLRPEPGDHFERVSDAVLTAFPDLAPYDGAHEGHTLHLTVASRLRGHEADQLLDDIGDVLPLTDRIERLSLMVETGAGWRETHSWPLPVA
jgi:hypothetical protein